MEPSQEEKRSDRLHRYKNRVIIAILLMLTVSIVLTMIFIAFTLRNRLIEDSKYRALELSSAIRHSLQSMMQARNIGGIQSTLEDIGHEDSPVHRAFVLNRNSTIAYSSRRSEIGRQFNRFSDESCKTCHTGLVIVPRNTTTIVNTEGREILRNVSVIYNEPSCHGCHDPLVRINGKLIIDMSMQPTTDLITAVEIIIAVSGVICLLFLVPFLSRYLSRGMNTYISEIVTKSTELNLLYRVVESLSRSISIDELKPIVVGILQDLYDPDEIEIVLPKGDRDSGGIAWKRTEGRIDRRQVHNDPYHDVIGEWTTGRLAAERVSSDRREIVMPINRGANRLALIVIRNHQKRFDEFSMGLTKAVESHIAVAFENAALYHIAITDELTGLYSKRYFWASLEKKFLLFERYGEKITVLMMDIDNFKTINDTYGHPAGDQVLKEISRYILLSTRDGDLDCRYGGEEFAVILPATDSHAGAIVAERIRSVIEKARIRLNENELRVTISIGLAACPEHTRSMRDLLVLADNALYAAKRQGKNQVVVLSTGG